MVSEQLDKEYFSLLANNEIEKARELVENQAEQNGFYNAIPERTAAYKIRNKKEPSKTIKAYKVFTVSDDGFPTALFIGGTEKLPVGVWLDAVDSWHFISPENGLPYVPSTLNPYTDAGKTGETHVFPEEARNYLVSHGFISSKSTSNKITCLAYRPGWHAGTMPFMPQVGKYGNHPYLPNGKINKNYDPSKPESNYKNIHRWNQVVCEVELSAEQDFTALAEAQVKAQNKKGELVPSKADLEYIPENGLYYYATNMEVRNNPNLGSWIIAGSIKINRVLTQEECKEILEKNGLKEQEWEGEILDLEKLGWNHKEIDAARKTLALITYDENGNIIPLSKRFDKNSNNILRESYNFSNISKSNSHYLDDDTAISVMGKMNLLDSEEILRKLEIHDNPDIYTKSISMKNGKITPFGWKQLSELLSTFSNKNYESSRILFIKDGKIVRSDVYSSFIPNESIGFENDQKAIEYYAAAKKMGAKIVYVHNHPSGYVSPSDADIKFTNVLENYFNKSEKNLFLGHIILDHGDYGIYSPFLKNGNSEKDGWIVFSKNKFISLNFYENNIYKNLSDEEKQKKFINETDIGRLLSKAASKLDNITEWDKTSWTPAVFLSERKKINGITYIHNDEFIDHRVLSNKLKLIGSNTGSTRCYLLPSNQNNYNLSKNFNYNSKCITDIYCTDPSVRTFNDFSTNRLFNSSDINNWTKETFVPKKLEFNHDKDKKMEDHVRELMEKNNLNNTPENLITNMKTIIKQEPSLKDNLGKLFRTLYKSSDLNEEQKNQMFRIIAKGCNDTKEINLRLMNLVLTDDKKIDKQKNNVSIGR